MTINEAIIRNTVIQMELLPLPMHRDWEAVQLGIEALELVRDGRTKPGGMFFHDLPGETES